MTSQQMVQLVLTTVLFITVILAGVFGAEISANWLRNRREQRRGDVREAEQRMSDRYDRERNSWLEIIAEKDREIDVLNGMVKKLEKNYEIATRVLAVADSRKEGEAA